MTLNSTPPSVGRETDPRTIGQLVVSATDEVKGLVQDHIALAKAEVTAGAKVMGKGAGLLGGAAFMGLLGLIFLFHSLARVIAIWLPVWAGYLIITATLLLVAAILGLVGVKALKSAKPVPERAIASAQTTIADLSADVRAFRP